MTTVRAWYFATEDRKLRYGDGRKVEVGVTHVHDGEIKLCESGLHASVDLISVLIYAPGPVACRVEMSGDIKVGRDKLVARSRKYLAVADASRTLHEFGSWCIQRGMQIEDITSNEIERCLELKRLWLDGSMTTTELKKAVNLNLTTDLDEFFFYKAAASVLSTNPLEAAIYPAIWARMGKEDREYEAQNIQLTTMLETLFKETHEVRILETVRREPDRMALSRMRRQN